MFYVPLFFLIFAIVFLTAIGMAGWAIVRVVTAIFGAVFGLNRKPQARAPGRSNRNAAFCARPNCRAINPAHARFCHRCGNAIAVARAVGRPPQPPPMRYVA
jgi:hypothetical protein